MTRRQTFIPLALAAAASIGFLAYRAVSSDARAASDGAAMDPELVFVNEVLPTLEGKCFVCHGDDPKDVESGLDLKSRDGMLKGGDSGKPALVPGDPKRSRIFIAATWEDPELEMPPREHDRLSPVQIEMLRKWIAGGAPWPDNKRQEALLAVDFPGASGVRVETSGAQSPGWANRRYRPEDLWAFKPVESQQVPWRQERRGALERLLDTLRGRKPVAENPVDAFIDSELGQKGFRAAGRADRITLIRRATYDLTGLPPTPAEVDAFLADQSPNAFARVVDRLLASPHYGEQWARHWLDVTRYANTGGYANDFERPNAWRYRDYVVRSLNQDKPYDRFIMEQVAGDEMKPSDPEMLVAVGFLRMGAWEHTGMSVAAETRQLFLDDVTNSVGETFLSVPLQCARCHDHKFDPIPTRDYYSIQAVFAPVQFAEREAVYLPSESRTGFDTGAERVLRRMQEAKDELAALDAKEEEAVRVWMAQRGIKYLPPKQRQKLPESQRPPRFLGLTHQDLGYQKLLQKRLQHHGRELERYEPLAFSVYNGPPVKDPSSVRPMRMPPTPEGETQATHILAGGSPYSPGERVSPAVLSAVRALAEKGERLPPDVLPTTPAGRRLAFARWLASEDNPLVTRSIVNRIWQHHFGTGIVATANNFGTMGKKPSHPELLDWLARHFVEKGWSIKTMHRLIMTSEAYQRAGTHPEMTELREVDPNNQLLAYFSPRRLTAEELRDGMLAASGELNPELGGLPIHPVINEEAALQPRHIMGSVAMAYQPSATPRERNRRTIYAFRYRGLSDPMLEVFNQPSLDLSCERRATSTVTPQVFALFNGQSSHDRALATARRLEREARTLRERIQRGILLAWNRPATPEEVQRSERYVTEMIRYHRENQPVPRKYPTQVKRKMFEEMTGEPFEFTERLDVYEHYVPDLQPSDVTPETRALADLALVLFNSNEFVYVY